MYDDRYLTNNTTKTSCHVVNNSTTSAHHQQQQLSSTSSSSPRDWRGGLRRRPIDDTSYNPTQQQQQQRHAAHHNNTRASPIMPEHHHANAATGPESSSSSAAAGGNNSSNPSNGVVSSSDVGGGSQTKEIYTYKAPWTVFALSWSHRPDPTSQFRLAIGSYVEQYSNSVQIVKKRANSHHHPHPPPNDPHLAAHHQNDHDHTHSSTQIFKACEFDHPYPCTKILWSPDRSTHSRDLLATTGDYLRLWHVSDDAAGGGTLHHRKEALLNNNKNSEYCAPLTSFDWNEADPNIVGTSSIDTTCTIWDVTAQTAKTQLIAHDREVFDLAFARGKDVFASVGADGSVRMFDLRSLEHSTIVYESQNLVPLLRLEWNKQDPNYLATFMVDSHRTIILDIRVPSMPVAELGGHSGCVNATAWAPHSSCHICTAGDDSQALIWDLSAMPKQPIEDPILAYNAEAEINNLRWSASQPDWVSITFHDKLQILRV